MKRISTKLFLLVAFCTLLIHTASAQNITVTGKVTDGTNPIPGAGVNVRGASTATVTNADGIYTISAPANGTLMFTYVGVTSKEIAINNRTTIDVVLTESTTDVEQVVIVGYGTQRKIDVTGAVGSINGTQISKQASVNAIGALQGKVAGVSITNSGSPGSSPTIRIRGLGSVNGSDAVLYVVDGVWLSDISFLNPNDIENMSILKDASSQSIYGIRAANGVVLITTKRGSGKLRINYDGYVGYQKATNQVEMANATEYATLVNEQAGSAQFANPSSFGEGTDWFNVILRNALQTQHNISVGGATENSNYNFSVGYLKQEGIVKNNEYERLNGRFTGDFKPSNFLKLGYNVILQSSNSVDMPGGLIYKAYTAAPVVPQFYQDGTYGDPNDFPIGNATNNPRAQLDFFNQRSRNYRVTGNLFAEVKIIPELTFRTSFGGEFGQGEVLGYTPVYIATVAQRNANSTLNVTRGQTRNWIVENTLTYDKAIGEHKFTVLAGHTAQRQRFYELFASARNVPYTREGDLYLRMSPNDPAFPRTVDDRGELGTYLSYFGRVNYAFSGKYLLNASVRADGSSKFINDQRWGYFPSVGAGWVISEEGFMKDQKTFNSLKLRASWGKVGNASVPANIATNLINQDASLTAIFGGVPSPGASITTIAPPLLYWERGVGTDIGLEATMMNNRLNLELDFYEKRTEQGIFDLPILGSIGTSNSSASGNQATFRNRGVEFMAGYTDKTSSGFGYSINANVSYNNNKVTATQSGANPVYSGGAASTGGQLSTRTIIGQPIGQFYGLQVEGIFQTAAEVAASKQKTAKPGDFRYADTNNDGVIDAKDRVVLGNPNPRFTYGLNTSFDYKNFDLSIDIQGVAGVEVYNANKGLRFGSENYSKDFFDNRWNGPGTSNTYPSANIGGGDNYKPNSWYVEDGSYIRIRNIQLGYNFASEALTKRGLQKVRVFVDAQNAFNFFKYTGFTPEVFGGGPVSAGIDNGIYPLAATYRLGLNVSF